MPIALTRNRIANVLVFLELLGTAEFLVNHIAFRTTRARSQDFLAPESGAQVVKIAHDVDGVNDVLGQDLPRILFRSGGDVTGVKSVELVVKQPSLSPQWVVRVLLYLRVDVSVILGNELMKLRGIGNLASVNINRHLIDLQPSEVSLEVSRSISFLVLRNRAVLFNYNLWPLASRNNSKIRKHKARTVT